MRSIIASITVICLLLAAAPASWGAKPIQLKDPTGDDKGPGKYQYPSDPAYKPGSFDLTGLTITDRGSDLEFRVTINARIEDPWNSKSWGGNGFSLQLVQVYLNTKKGGFLGALPGINVKFPKGHAWDRVVFISPQPRSKIVAELKAKAGKKRKGVVIPKRVYARGRELVAVVAKADLGSPSPSWGIQAVMQSNEGYADAHSVLARKVNEYRGQHRFGGGNDYDCDPHVVDIFAGKATGDPSERQAQYEALGKYTCDAAGKGKKAVVPMLYPAR